MIMLPAAIAIPGAAYLLSHSISSIPCVVQFPPAGVNRVPPPCVRAGLVAQQQCCGSLQLPVADVAVLAQAHTGVTGAATAIGEQPLKGLVDPAAMARLALGEALTNLVWAAATGLADIKASVNWMCAPLSAFEQALPLCRLPAVEPPALLVGGCVTGGYERCLLHEWRVREAGP